MPRLAAPPADPDLGALWLRKTDLPPSVLRRDIRLVGQPLHGRDDWERLEKGAKEEAGAVCDSSEEDEAPEEE